MLIAKISNINDLYFALYEIGTKKKELPEQLRGWVNILGLYVQQGMLFPGGGVREYLMAGGKFIKCFSSVCDFTMDITKNSEIQASTLTGDFSHWKINKFDEVTWDRRFALLVTPTFEIAWYLSRDLVVSKEKDKLLNKLSNVVRHFKTTGEWLGLHDSRCINCGKEIDWWFLLNRYPCPICGARPKD